MKRLALAAVLVCALGAAFIAEDAGARRALGHLSANPHAPGSTANPAGRTDPDSVTNPHGRYGSRASPQSAANPFAANPPALEDSAGRYRGKLSANSFEADSVANPYGRYGSRYSADSINNPYGAGNPLALDSPHHRHGQGLRVIAPK